MVDYEELAYEIEKIIGQKNNATIQRTLGFVDRHATTLLGDKIVKNVKRHAANVTWAGAAAAVSVTAAMSFLTYSTWRMYYDINTVIGISFSDNFLKSVASGIASNLISNGAAFAASYGATAVVNKIPVYGQVAGIVAGAVINRTALYAAAGSYLAILKTVISQGNISEAAFNAAFSVGDIGVDQNTTTDSPYGSSEIINFIYRSNEEELRRIRNMKK